MGGRLRPNVVLNWVCYIHFKIHELSGPFSVLISESLGDVPPDDPKQWFTSRPFVEFAAYVGSPLSGYKGEEPLSEHFVPLTGSPAMAD